MEEHKTEHYREDGEAEEKGEEGELETKPRAPDHPEAASGGVQPDSGGAYDSMLWSRILDEQGDDDMALSADEDDAGDGPGGAGDEHDHPEFMILPQHDRQAAGDSADGIVEAFAPGSPYSQQQQQSGFQDDAMSVKMEPTTPFDHWGQHYDPELGLPTNALSEFASSFALPTSSSPAAVASAETGPPSGSTLMCLPSSNLSPVYEGYTAPVDSHIGIAVNQQPSSPRFMTGASFWQRPHVLSFGPQPNGFPFPLSKPLIRDDGALLVGTEGTMCDTHGNWAKNRIFVTNFLCSASPMAPTTSHIIVEKEVRDMQWLSASTAVVAVGNEIQILLVGEGMEPCRLLDPITTIHGDAIREVAVQTSSCSVLSGGFDQTVVLSDLNDQHNPGAASLVSKYDAHDVVSSLRWSPSETEFSWTTDGGDFKVVDKRARSSSLVVPLSVEYMNETGGLFTHDYLSTSQVALGFERGQIAFVDTRMPRTDPYAVIASSLATVGEIRRAKQHQSNKFAIFGYGGFATAQASINQAKQLVLDNLAPLQEHQIGITRYKTSGDFSFENGDYLAVTDNLGTVSLYNAVDAPSETSHELPHQGDAWRL